MTHKRFGSAWWNRVRPFFDNYLYVRDKRRRDGTATGRMKVGRSLQQIPREEFLAHSDDIKQIWEDRP